jgi:hypothetical protein
MVAKKTKKINISDLSKTKIHELSGKALKAFNNLESGIRSYEDNQKVLKEIYLLLLQIMGNKCVNMPVNFPKRIKFFVGEELNINFYIDFSVLPSGGENTWDLEGNIIYGAYIKDRFDDTEKDKCKICGSTILCDCFRPKPLLSLKVNEHGLIESKDKIEDNWVIKVSDNSKQVPTEQNLKVAMEFHYKALEYIFLEALYFMNERYTNL